MVLILTYHSIDSSGSVISTAPDRFRRQMRRLRDSSFSVLSLAGIACCLRGGKELPKNAVAITFDDGYRNLYQEAFPVLQEYGYPATVFLVTGLCGGKNLWQGNSPRVPLLDLLEWEQIDEMASHGVDFGAHSMTHADLSRLEERLALDEIIGSKLAIEERIGRRAESFAWPFGRPNKQLLHLVRDEFEATCTTDMDSVTFRSDRHALPRIDMYYFSRNERFSDLGHRSFAHYVRLRKNLRFVRGLLTGG